MSPALPSAWRGAALAAALALGVSTLVQAARLHRALRLTRQLAAGAHGFQSRPRTVAHRVLVLGDSTGLGVGAGSAAASVGGLLASDYAGLRVDNFACTGARVVDVLLQLDEAAGRGVCYDLLLLLVGGNDVVRGTRAADLQRQVRCMLERSRSVASSVVWLGVANVGAAPVFFPPLSWWISRRTQRLTRLFAAAAAQYSVTFIDFFEEQRDDRFSREPMCYYAADGVHPSGMGYRHCYERAKREAGFDRCLAGKALAAA